jgi:hypothetical protein
MLAIVGVIEHHPEGCEAGQRIHERKPLGGRKRVLQRQPRTISTPPRNERCAGKNARQGADT